MKNILPHISSITQASIRLKEKEIPDFMNEIFDIPDFTDKMTEASKFSNRRTQTFVENKKVKYEYYGKNAEWKIFDKEFYNTNHTNIADVRVYDEPEVHVFNIDFGIVPVNETEEDITQFLIKKTSIKEEVEYIVIIKYALNPSGDVRPIPHSCILKLINWSIRNDKINQCRFTKQEKE